MFSIDQNKHEEQIQNMLIVFDENLSENSKSLQMQQNELNKQLNAFQTEVESLNKCIQMKINDITNKDKYIKSLKI